MSDHFSTGDKVRANADHGGIFENDTHQGQTGEVVDVSALGGTSKVRWEDGSVTEAPNDRLGHR